MRSHKGTSQKDSLRSLCVFVFSGGIERAVRRDRSADGGKKGRSPVTLLCFGHLFLLAARRSPRTGLPRVSFEGEQGKHWGVEGVHTAREPRLSRYDVAEQREGWLRVSTNAPIPRIVQGCSEMWPGGTSAAVPIDIILSDRVCGGAKERSRERVVLVWCPAGRLSPLVCLYELCVCG